MAYRENGGRRPRAEHRRRNPEGSPGLSLRLARLAEATAIANLSRDLIEYGLHWRWTPGRVATSIHAPEVNVLVACVHGNIVGFGIMRYGRDDAHLNLFAVAPPYRRAGIGYRLLGWLEKCAVAAGNLRVALEVREGNEGARLFYERMGYRTLARAPGYYQGVEAALRMERELSSGSLEPEIRELQQKILEEVFGKLPDYINDLSINRGRAGGF